MPRPGWVKGRMQPPRWYSTSQKDWNAEDWRLAKKAGEVRKTPYDPPPFEPDQSMGVIPPPGPQPSFSVFAKPRRRATSSARSDAIDKLIEKQLGPR